MNTTQRAPAYQRDEQRVHLIRSHLIWCPRRPQPVRVGPVAARWRALVERTCAEKGWDILALALQPAHTQLFVRVWPSASAAAVVKACTGPPAFQLRREFAALLKLPSLWTRRSFASTAGHVRQQT